MTKTPLIITDTVETAGQVAYWRIATTTSIPTLTKAWKDAGLDEKDLPKAPADIVALGRAVAAQGEKRQLVRPLAKRGAWAIVEETVKEGQTPTYRTLVSVRFEDGNGPAVKNEDATFGEFSRLHDLIHNGYEEARGVLAHTDVSQWLLRHAQRLHAVTLRESGGVYFIPKDSVAQWDKIANAVSVAGSDIFRIPAMKTDEAVKAITDAITQEAEKAINDVYAELAKTGDDALGKRALTTRSKEADELLEKIGAYEKLLDQQLTIRSRIDSLKGAIVAASFAADSEAA